nr:acetoacetate decarboxylase family protein [Variovorax sp. 770b2]
MIAGLALFADRLIASTFHGRTTHTQDTLRPLSSPEATGSLLQGVAWILPGSQPVEHADSQARFEVLTTDGHELLDPVLAQYRETIVVLEIERPDGSRCMYCPAIWVDQDISLLRGLLQGWPKKMSSTWLTRSLPLEHPAAAPMIPGSQLGASLAVLSGRPIASTANSSRPRSCRRAGDLVRLTRQSRGCST